MLKRILRYFELYTKSDMESFYWQGVVDGRASVDSLKFVTNYFNPSEALVEFTNKYRNDIL